jgi:hypothetical protein
MKKNLGNCSKISMGSDAQRNFSLSFVKQLIKRRIRKMKVRKAKEGLFMEFENEDGERVVMSLETMFGRIWDDFIRGILTNEYTRGILHEMGLKETEIFRLLERLQIGRTEFGRGDYKEVAYL